MPCVALFDETPDEALADAGPWLLDCTGDRDSHMASLQRLGDSAVGCLWIVSGYAVDDLALALRARLNAHMPNGSTALLRYYDARITDDIAALLTPAQRAAFFAPGQDWLVQRNGQLIRIHQNHGGFDWCRGFTSNPACVAGWKSQDARRISGFTILCR